MSEPIQKRVDESWKEQAEREKQVVAGSPAAGPKTDAAQQAPAAEPAGRDELPQARFDLFISGLAVEAFVALGEMPHPRTKRQSINLPQAKYLIDLMGLLDEKTKGNLSVEEERLLKETLYQLRMQYLAKSGGVAPV